MSRTLQVRHEQLKMSSNGSKIPIYKKSSLPVASKDYRNVVKDVKKRQSAIEVKLNSAQNLKAQLDKLAADIEATKGEVHGRFRERTIQGTCYLSD